MLLLQAYHFSLSGGTIHKNIFFLQGCMCRHNVNKTFHKFKLHVNCAVLTAAAVTNIFIKSIGDLICMILQLLLENDALNTHAMQVFKNSVSIQPY